jgi:hypothetical protein
LVPVGPLAAPTRILWVLANSNVLPRNMPPLRMMFGLEPTLASAERFNTPPFTVVLPE